MHSLVPSISVNYTTSFIFRRINPRTICTENLNQFILHTNRNESFLFYSNARLCHLSPYSDLVLKTFKGPYDGDDIPYLIYSMLKA